MSPPASFRFRRRPVLAVVLAYALALQPLLLGAMAAIAAQRAGAAVICLNGGGAAQGDRPDDHRPLCCPGCAGAACVHHGAGAALPAVAARLPLPSAHRADRMLEAEAGPRPRAGLPYRQRGPPAA